MGWEYVENCEYIGNRWRLYGEYMEYMAIYTNRWKYSTVWESMMISWSFNLGFNGDIMGTMRNGAKI